ncbi:hypothetical protein ACC807_08045 [Rhizobium ruizarguesonis]|uniref:hypothetical protein n=1 Tax=Rhizobium ruizarguesonis TaxID=2081791 RepID=UPI001FDFC6F0|nr:hypothetical protein [Rhizobium ruizarguesonis]
MPDIAGNGADRSHRRRWAADGLDQALDIVTARNRTAQDRPSQFGVIGKIIEEWEFFSVAARHVVLRNA